MQKVSDTKEQYIDLQRRARNFHESIKEDTESDATTINEEMERSVDKLKR